MPTPAPGVRESPRCKTALVRVVVHVEVLGETVAVKVGRADGVLVQVMSEFDEVAAPARRQGRSEREVLFDNLGRDRQRYSAGERGSRASSLPTHRRCISDADDSYWEDE
ncbi:nickel insertion protein [Cryptosporangium aurantiacum]|uniref:nickel insertion protein n=1 Tax=Cryptosporangium aurantiacum TaxID=134849 RepID=UPI000933C76B|nr:nickel insertion protein [Cryptosporangium aurantiacum]